MADQTARLRIGIIGLGKVAQIIHLPILRALPERFRDCHLRCLPALPDFIGERYAIPAAPTPGRLRRISATTSVSSR